MDAGGLPVSVTRDAENDQSDDPVPGGGASPGTVRDALSARVGML